MSIHMQSAEGSGSQFVYFGEAAWHSSARQLTVRDQPVKLPWRVAECLAMLIEARGAVVSKGEIQRQIWGDSLVEDSNLAKCINGVRRALDPAPGGGSYVETVARVGYRLAIPLTADVLPAPAVPSLFGRKLWMFTILAFGGIALFAVAATFLGARAEKLGKAHELSKQALVLLRRGNYPDGAKAMPLLHQALDQVPGFALAHAALAEGVARFGESSFASASELARKSVREDPNCGECQGILGFVLYTREWKWHEAGERLRRAVEFEPENLQLRLWYTNWLATQNRMEDASLQAEAAVRLTPSSPQARSALAMTHFFTGNFSKAIAACNDAIELDPRHTAGFQWLARAYMMTGDDSAALSAHSREVAAWGGWSLQEEAQFSRVQRDLYSRSGRIGVARSWIDEVGSPGSIEVQRYNRALWFMWIGEHASAVAELESAVRSRPYHLLYVAVDPAFAPLRTTARFQRIVSSMGLKL